MSSPSRLLFCLAASVLVASLFASAQQPATRHSSSDAAAGATVAPPKAKAQPVVDDYHGRKITDPYRWMEDADAPDTQQYVRDQLAYTRFVLDPLPGRDKIQTRLTALLQIGNLGTPQVGGLYYFYTRREGGQNQPILYVRDGLNGKDRVLVDVNPMAADGTVALDWWKASRDGKYVAYGTSQSGNEMSTLRVIETATGEVLPDTIERTRGAYVQWKPDNSGFYYGRYPKKGDVPPGQENYNRRVFYHALGSDPARDPLTFGEGLKPEEWPYGVISNDGQWLLLGVSFGTGTVRQDLYIKDLKTNAPAIPVATGKDFKYRGEVHEGKIYILTNEDAPRWRICVTDAARPGRENWRELIPQSDAIIEDANIIGGKLVLEYEKNASSLLKVFSLDGRLLKEIALPTIGSITGVGGNWEANDAFYNFNSYTVPPTIYHYDLATGKNTEWARVKADIDASPYQVKQVWFKSKDATRVPMFVVSRKDVVMNGANPTLLYGYGGFNISMTPTFNRGVYLWLERGGIYAVANLRGGNEFGEEWHRQGMLDKKQNVFDDFISAAEYLIANKYTDRDHLAIQGGSNGGLLVGAALTQRPDLFKAVVCQVPLLDMLRYQNFIIAKLWVSEYGSAEDPQQFDYLLRYSPYQNVKEGVKYPATLLLTADSDARVDPMHAKKMAARLQAANAGPNPILLRVETKAGHGQGKPVSKQIEEATDVYSFLFWQVGVKP